MELLKGSFAMRHADDSATLLPRLEPGEQGLADDTNYIWMRDYSDNYFQLYTTGPVGALSGSLTSGKIPVANGIHSVADSIITQSGTAISIAGSLALTSTTDATSISNGAWHIDGGASVTKALWVGGLANIAGAVTLQSTLVMTSTGNPSLIIGANTTTTPELILNGASANRKRIRFMTAGFDRWNIRQGNTAESGSDAGSEFELVAFNDAGAGIDSPISIVRATGGIITLARPVSMTKTLGVTGVATFAAAPVFSSLTASSLVATDGSKALTSSVSGLSPTFTGLTLSGKLTVQSNTSDAITVGTGSSAPGITINGAAGNYRTLTFQTNGAIRWVISTTSASELGSNAGSLFDLAAYTDAGSLIDHPISIGRDSGNSISFSRAGVFQGALSTNKKLTGLFFTVSSLGSQTISGTVGTPDTITCGNLGRTVITPSSVPNDYANIDTASATDGQLLHITNASATVVLYLTNIYNGPILLNPKEGKTFSYNSTLGWLTA